MGMRWSWQKSFHACDAWSPWREGSSDSPPPSSPRLGGGLQARSEGRRPSRSKPRNRSPGPRHPAPGSGYPGPVSRCPCPRPASFQEGRTLWALCSHPPAQSSLDLDLLRAWSLMDSGQRRGGGLRGQLQTGAAHTGATACGFSLTDLMDVSLSKLWEIVRASLIAQLVKNPPAVQETWVPFLGRADPLEKG